MAKPLAQLIGSGENLDFGRESTDVDIASRIAAIIPGVDLEYTTCKHVGVAWHAVDTLTKKTE